MNTKGNRSSDRQTGNYQQPQVDGAAQTVLTDQAITAETDELDPAFNLPGPPVDPEDEEEEEEDDDDDFPVREDLEEEDFDLNHDQDDDLSLNIDDDELN